MLKLRSLLVLSSLFLFAVFSCAQGTVVTSVPVGHGAGTTMIGGMTGGSFTFTGNTGQPFSADVVEENDRFLADGNHIHYEVHGKIFRDSEGRMRTETEAPHFTPDSKPFVHINITDLVEGRIIFLDAEHKIATVTLLGKPQSHPGVGGSISPTGNHTQTPVAPAVTNSGQRTAPVMRDSSPEDLGTSQIEGFTVMGTRYTHVVEAGVMGNDKPIATTSERWFSTDLKADLVNISESPDSGKHVRKLVNIRAGEPDPLLFQVPPDFTVKETQQQ